MPSSSWITTKAEASIAPLAVGSTLSALAENWPDDAPALKQLVEEFPLGEGALLHLISVSSICATRLKRNPELLLWLSEPDICEQPRTKRRMLADLRHSAENISADKFRALRLWKGREMLRIALREVAETASLEETTAELSQLAEICVGEVLHHWHRDFRKRFGTPNAAFAVVGFGKLGGRELNHSSDIDVLFFYSEEGQVTANLSHHQWFNRLAAKISETFAYVGPSGSLFRMDSRLRPEGSAGPMARSLESLENYYSGFGETWERLALIKARGVAGDEELAYEFLRQHQPFIYPRSPTPELLDEISAIKRRIERDIVGHENLERNVKLGTGGIREIEFVVQALQLLHSARHAFLQETSTLKVLPALAELELLPRSEALDLEGAYRFLRRVEHRLQIEAEQQTHTVPEEPEALRKLAMSLGFGTPAEFTTALREHTQRVRAVFERVIAAQPHDAEAAMPMRLEMFRDSTAAERALAELGQGRGSFHVAPRTRQVFRKLRPMLLEWLAQATDPDATLTQIVRFVEAYGMRSLLFELLVANPRLLELVVKTFDASRFASDLLIRRPQLLEDVTRAGMLDRNVMVAQHLRALRKSGGGAGKLEPVRAYKQAQLLRILIRDVLGVANEQALESEHSALAEACLKHVHSIVAGDSDLTVIALGKFGGAELSYGADLDIVFIGENTRAAQELIVEMGKSTAEGSIAALDARLRPDGGKGPLVTPLSAFGAYYETRAQFWEIQALTRARAICGPHGPEFIEMAKQAWRRAGARGDLFHLIDAMRGRIHRDRSSGSEILDFKTGLGGIIQAEFLVQALQMRAGEWNPRFAGALEALSATGVMAAADAAALRRAMIFCAAANQSYGDGKIKASARCRPIRRNTRSWHNASAPRTWIPLAPIIAPRARRFTRSTRATSCAPLRPNDRLEA
jgi:glutamate-ammonia-ligase adenylyltransferase